MTWQNRLRFAIARSGKRQEQVAIEAGLSPDTLLRILEGQLDPDIEDVIRLAESAGVTVAALLGERPATVRRIPDAEIPAAFAARGASLVYAFSSDAVPRHGLVDGDLLFVQPAHDAREAAGRLVICRIDGEECVKMLEGEERELDVIGIVVGRSGPIE